MTETTTTGTDVHIGLAMVFGALAFVGVLTMYVAGVGENQLLSGWGFAAAMLAGSLLVAALHLYG